ncbi:MAG TPA: phosphatase PAP2 family protein [Candidatus Acidoferrales bacterium]|jgi:undecaprenyl-diphosphatase|nr:phosphatase PAP2 family protein [Candidatus Acidoferrales bacterium]
MAVSRAVWGFIKRRDHRLMRRLHRWRAPRWIRYWMLSATRLGDGWLWYSLGVILLVFGGPERYEAVGSALVAAFASIFLFQRLKKASRRRRPCQLEPHCWVKILPPDQFSFPSGHTMTAFAIVFVVSAYYPHLEAPLYFLAVSIAISRLVLGMHFLSDVVAGAALGGGLGYVTHALFRSFHLP